MNVENSGLKHHVMCRELQIFYRPGGKNGCRRASVRMELRVQDGVQKLWEPVKGLSGGQPGAGCFRTHT